jgi:hypothetical protein
MVTFYGAGERTGILNVEAKLGKILDKQEGTLVVKASDRDTILDEISARAARYKSFDPDTFAELMTLRANVRDIFNKGMDPGAEIMEQLYFLDSTNRALVEKMSATYDLVVTPQDFKAIANIMSDHLAEQVPILKDFTKFFGRLAEDFLKSAKPSKSAFDWKAIGEIIVFGRRKKGPAVDEYVGDLLGLNKLTKELFGSRFSEMLGVDPKTPITEQVLKKFSWFKPNSSLADILLGGTAASETRRTGAKYAKIEIFDILNVSKGFQLFYANKLPKKWTNVPWVNFDGKVLEQNFTQTYEERLLYRDKDGNMIMNVIQVPQKTEASWWEQVINKEGQINDIADVTKARTAYAVNGNHSNDATLVKGFHLWGKKNNIPTSTIHDAFFANASDMIKARAGLRDLYATAVDKQSVRATLDEMRARGLPKEIYQKYLDEAIETGLIPVIGRSRINGVLLTKEDILTKQDILGTIPDPAKFNDDLGFYGIG